MTSEPYCQKWCQKRENTFIVKNTGSNQKEAGLTLFVWDGGAGSFAMTWAESQESNTDFPVVNLAELNLAVIR